MNDDFIILVNKIKKLTFTSTMNEPHELAG
jgi:hypothetical protein